MQENEFIKKMREKMEETKKSKKSKLMKILYIAGIIFLSGASLYFPELHDTFSLLLSFLM